MPVLDTEALFGLRAGDSRHTATHRRLTLLTRRHALLYAPDSALLEFQLVLRAEEKPAGAIRSALLALKAKLLNYGIIEARTFDIGTLALQAEVEERYGLSYFDSLVAASAKALDGEIVSDDRAFDLVPGLKRVPLS